jgi:hypothetical protein
MDSVTLLAAGWTSGVNAPLTVLLLGIAGRAGWADTPEALRSPVVLALAAVLYALEFVIDKVPLLDSAWDLLNTAVRPVIGAWVAAGFVGTGRDQLLAALAGAALALTAHGAKATTRLAINASPEPFTNIAASLGEDGLVATIVTVSFAHPRVAATLAMVAMVLTCALAWVLLRMARRGLRLLRRRRTRTGPAPGTAPAIDR